VFTIKVEDTLEAPIIGDSWPFMRLARLEPIATNMPSIVVDWRHRQSLPSPDRIAEQPAVPAPLESLQRGN